MSHHHKINYIEIPSRDLNKTKEFFAKVFDLSFIDYGPNYIAFEDAGIDGGFFQSDLKSLTANGSALIIFYSEALESTLNQVTLHQGEIIKDIFTFPGGRRFHFLDTNGNEFAVWSE
ncbi:VOC family protein [bacterium]|nr:VOC family protein [bacterium]